MRPSARISAAIDILQQFNGSNSPVRNVLAAWARTNRYAGSKDRRAINDLVFDSLRRGASYGAYMGNDSPRTVVLAALADAWSTPLDEIEALCDGEKFSPQPLSDVEREGLQRLVQGHSDEADPRDLADLPDWLYASFERAFGDAAQAEGQGLSSRAPIDLRANSLQTSRDQLLEELAEWRPQPIDGLEDGVRIEQPGKGQRVPQLESLPLFEKGSFELQDKGSQIAALMTGVAPGKQVLDLCAGAGGKTLAMAALMNNKGQIHAYDIDDKRLSPLGARARRAGVRNLQVLGGGDKAALAALNGKMDVVLVDAPCTGSGTWRRKPDSKWRLTPEQLQTRLKEQNEVLALGARAVKSGGQMIYVTCSLLPEENEDRIDAFLQSHADFSLVPYEQAWAQARSAPAPQTALANEALLQLTPARHAADGFFVAILQKS